MGKLNYLHSLWVVNSVFFKNNVFFFVLFFTLFLCICGTSHNKHVRSENVCGRPCRFWGLNSGMQTWQKAFLFLRPSCCFQCSVRVCVRVQSQAPLSLTASHTLFSKTGSLLNLELDWLATELWMLRLCPPVLGFQCKLSHYHV